MGGEHYCLRWNNHQNNLLGVFSQLLQEEALVDVTLACAEGHSIRAHKVVLSACSAYFANLFLEYPGQEPIIVLKDVRFEDLQTLVHFMYRGEVNVEHRQLPALLKTAESLRVKGLTEMTHLRSPAEAAAAAVAAAQMLERGEDERSMIAVEPQLTANELQQIAEDEPLSLTCHKRSPIEFQSAPATINKRFYSQSTQRLLPPRNRVRSPLPYTPVRNKFAPLSKYSPTEPLSLSPERSEGPPDTSPASAGYEMPSDPESDDSVRSGEPNDMTIGDRHRRSPKHPRADDYSPIDLAMMTPIQNAPLSLKMEVNNSGKKEEGRSSGDEASVSGAVAATGNETTELNYFDTSPPSVVQSCSHLLPTRNDLLDAFRPPRGFFLPTRDASSASASAEERFSRSLAYRREILQSLVAPQNSAGVPSPSPRSNSNSTNSNSNNNNNNNSETSNTLDHVSTSSSSSSQSPTPYLFPPFHIPLLPSPYLPTDSPLSLYSFLHHPLASPFSSPSDLTLGRLLKCSICLASFPNGWLLEQHTVLQHSGQSPRRLPMPPTSVADLEDKPFQCDQCGQSYRYRSAFVKHREQNHRARLPADKLFTCDICGMQFRYLKSFKKHRLNHALERLQPNTPIAPKKEPKEAPRKVETTPQSNAQSDDDSTAPTHVSESQVSSSNEIDVQSSDKSTHSATDETELTNSLSGSEPSLYNLLGYPVERQKDRQVFECTFCSKTVRSKENLKLHVRKHTGERPFACLFCGRAFGGKSDLTRHVRIHTGERPYHCEMCGKCFARADYLSKHLTTHLHTNSHHTPRVTSD